MGATGGFRNAFSPECEENRIVELKRIWELVGRKPTLAQKDPAKNGQAIMQYLDLWAK